MDISLTVKGVGQVGDGQRDDEKEKEGLLSTMGPPIISQSALGSSMKRCSELRHLLSRNVRVGAWGGPALWLPIGRDVQEVPDQDSVVMGTADNLELIKLETENASRVLH